MQRKIPSWGEVWEMIKLRILGDGLTEKEMESLMDILGWDGARSVIAANSVFRKVDVETLAWLVEHLGGPGQIEMIKTGQLAILIQGRSTAKQRPSAPPPPPMSIPIVVDRQLPVPCQTGMELLLDENDATGPAQYDLLKNVSGWVPEAGKPLITVWGFRQSLKKSNHLPGGLSFHDAAEIRKHGVETFERVFGKVDKVLFVRKVATHDDGTVHAPCLSPQDGKLMLSWEPVTLTLGPKVAVAILRTAKG